MASGVPDGTKKNGKIQLHRAINIQNLILTRKIDVTMGGRPWDQFDVKLSPSFLLAVIKQQQSKHQAANQQTIVRLSINKYCQAVRFIYLHQQ